ncbi:MAG: tetratricopeptide repeat-containing glycosyltransferase family protein [Alphaproteobacteria bacterium]|nr:tetratricopeptide repeat-containing glycosyltransferase family protein [Alphaproteobacteria bacterium]
MSPLPSPVPDIVDRLRARDFAGAAATAERALRQSPQDPDLLHLLGLARRQLGQMDQAIAAMESAAGIDPRRASFHFSLGQLYGAAGRAEAAIQCFERAITLEPAHARAQYELACLSRAAGDLERAERLLRACLALDRDHAGAHAELGAALLDRGRADLAVPVLEAGLVLAPSMTALHVNLGNALRDLGRPLEALPYYERALELQPGAVEIELNRAFALLRAGRLTQGFAAYEVRRRKRGLVRTALAERPAWDGTPLAGRTLMVHAEQGQGDSIQFVRYAALARAHGLEAGGGGRVIVECQKRLLRLFQGQGGALADLVIARGDKLPEFDVQAPMMSLPFLMRTNLADIPAPVPYLKPVPGIDFTLRDPPHMDSLRVGLVWSGNAAHHQDRMRSCPLEALAPVLSLARVAIYPLQLDVAPADRALLAARDSVVMPERRQEDFADLAAAMAGLDLVVSVDTAAAHLAGAMGVPAIVLLSHGADWRWMLDRADSPWYPGLTLIRQPRPGDWAGVVQRLTALLRARIGAKR